MTVSDVIWIVLVGMTIMGLLLGVEALLQRRGGKKQVALNQGRVLPFASWILAGPINAYPGSTPLSLVFPDDGIRLGEIVGRRAWHVDIFSGYLLALNSPIVWPPGEAMEAHCESGVFRGAPHEAPDEACTCGLYALKPGQDVADCWGEVELWGSYLEGERGYCAQYARPTRINRVLFLGKYDQKILDRVTNRYPEIAIVDTWEEAR